MSPDPQSTTLGQIPHSTRHCRETSNILKNITPVRFKSREEFSEKIHFPEFTTAIPSSSRLHRGSSSRMSTYVKPTAATGRGCGPVLPGFCGVASRLRQVFAPLFGRCIASRRTQCFPRLSVPRDSSGRRDPDSIDGC